MDLTTLAGRQELGVRIQSAIMAAGYGSLPDFAREQGWSRALIYQYVSGRVLVQLDRLQRIAEVTGKPLSWFLAADPAGDTSRTTELQTQLTQAREALADERGQRLAEDQRARRTSASLLADLCRAQRRNGDAAALLETGARLLELSHQDGNEREALTALLHLGHAWFLQGELPRAEAVLREALALAQRLDETSSLAAVRQELLRVLLQGGQTAVARAEAVALSYSEAWWPRWSGQVSLAAIAIQAGRPAEAAGALDTAEAVIAESDEPAARRLTAETYVLSNRATLALATGDYRQAGALSERLRTVAARAGVLDQIREAELNLALIAVRRGEVGRAAERLALLGDWADLAGDGRLRVLVQVFRSELARRCGDLQRARAEARLALAEAEGLKQAQVRLEAELALAQAEQELGRPDEAAYGLQACLETAANLQYSRAQLQARLLLAAGTEPGAPEPAWPALAADLEQAGATDLALDLVLLRARALPADAARPLLADVATRARTLDYFWPAHAALLRLAGLSVEYDVVAAASYYEQARLLRKARVGRTACRAVSAAERAVRGLLPPRSAAPSDASSPAAEQ